MHLNENHLITSKATEPLTTQCKIKSYNINSLGVPYNSEPYYTQAQQIKTKTLSK